MKLQNYKYVCKSCAKTFKSANLSENHYAEFLMRTKTGKMAYLFAIGDEVFSKIKHQFESMPKLKNIDTLARVTILHQIFCITCDLANDGTEYKIGGKPICPKCGSNKMYSWESIYPPEMVEMNVPHVTHDRWNKLTDAEKKSKIEEAVERVLANNDNLEIL